MSISVHWVPGITLEEIEKQCILAAFRFYRGNKTQTAQTLGINIRTLERKMEDYEAANRREDERRNSEEFEREKTLARLRGVEFTRDNSVGSSNQNIPKRETSSYEAEAGFRVQSTETPSPQPEMSMPERKEVQGMLPRQASSGGQRGRR